MATVQAAGYQNRQIIDSNLTNSTAIGTAGSTVQSAAFDTGDNTDGFFPEKVELQITVPACPNLAAPGVATSLTFTVLADSAATPTTALPLSFTVAGTSGTGSVAVTKNFRIPGNAARYIAVQVAAGANAGNNSAVSFTASLCF
jgi:hypothetical protein